MACVSVLAYPCKQFSGACRTDVCGACTPCAACGPAHVYVHVQRNKIPPRSRTWRLGTDTPDIAQQCWQPKMPPSHMQATVRRSCSKQCTGTWLTMPIPCQQCCEETSSPQGNTRSWHRASSASVRARLRSRQAATALDPPARVCRRSEGECHREEDRFRPALGLHAPSSTCFHSPTTTPRRACTREHH